MQPVRGELWHVDGERGVVDAPYRAHAQPLRHHRPAALLRDEWPQPGEQLGRRTKGGLPHAQRPRVLAQAKLEGAHPHVRHIVIRGTVGKRAPQHHLARGGVDANRACRRDRRAREQCGGRDDEPDGLGCADRVLRARVAQLRKLHRHRAVHRPTYIRMLERTPDDGVPAVSL